MRRKDMVIWKLTIYKVCKSNSLSWKSFNPLQDVWVFLTWFCFNYFTSFNYFCWYLYFVISYSNTLCFYFLHLFVRFIIPTSGSNRFDVCVLIYFHPSKCCFCVYLNHWFVFSVHLNIILPCDLNPLILDFLLFFLLLVKFFIFFILTSSLWYSCVFVPTDKHMYHNKPVRVWFCPHHCVWYRDHYICSEWRPAVTLASPIELLLH